MKIATWNVNSIRTREEIVLNWLKNNDIDVLCLQETKVTDDLFPMSNFQELGYHVYISGQKAYNGVAIFSKQKMTDIVTGFSPIIGVEKTGIFHEQKRVISGVINDIRIVNLYVPNGSSVGSEKYEYKLKWLEILREYLQLLREKTPSEMLICGDINIALENKDIYKPKGNKDIMASDLERESLRKVLEIGFKDVLRKFTTETGFYTWWDYRRSGFSNNRGWRIDHFYLTEKLYEKAVNCYIDIEPRKLPQPSDHAPVIVEF
jgi:exodeoxyribonuclease III